MKFSNKKKIILGSIIGVLIGTLMSVSYAFFTYANSSGENSTLVTGNIFMRYRETNTLTLEDAMPSDTYDATKKFEFTIDGTNTTENKDVWYEIKVKHGTIPEATPAKSKEDRIPDRFIKYKLVKEVNNVEQTVVDGDSWEGLSTGKTIYVDKIEKNKSNQVHNYKLYMWISNKLEIGTSPTANFTIQNWNKAFASIKVDVNGDFTEKVVDEPYQTVNAMYAINDATAPTINDQRRNIKEVYFNKMSESQMNTKYNAATIKADLTYNNEGKVLAWLETNNTDPTKFNLIVASDGDTYLTTGVGFFNGGFSNLEKIQFNNINTSRVTSMQSMFQDCSSLTSLDLSRFDTSNVTSMSMMFLNCSSLTNLNLSSFDMSGLSSSGSVANMFKDCTSLARIYVSNTWNVSNQPSGMPIFTGCTSLVGQAPNITYNFDSSEAIDKTYAVVATDTTKGYLTDISLKPTN